MDDLHREIFGGTGGYVEQAISRIDRTVFQLPITRKPEAGRTRPDHRRHLCHETLKNSDADRHSDKRRRRTVQTVALFWITS